MALRATKGDKDAIRRCRGINELQRVFNGAVTARSSPSDRLLKEAAGM